MVICLNGQFVSEAEARVSVFDQGFLYGDGVYETLRTYNGKVFQMEEHLQRLARSCDFLKILLEFGLDEIADLIRETVRQNGFVESRIRVTVTRGMSRSLGASFKPFHAGPATLCIFVYEIPKWEEGVFQEPVDVVTFEGERLYPEVKSLNMMTNILAREAAEKAGAFDALLVNRNGCVTEASAANLFLVKSGVVITPQEDVLLGTMRAAVLRVIVEMNVPVELRAVRKEELFTADEVFLTNTTKRIIPVKSVDGQEIMALDSAALLPVLQKSLDQLILGLC